MEQQVHASPRVSPSPGIALKSVNFVTNDRRFCDEVLPIVAALPEKDHWIIYRTLDELQTDLDGWLIEYNEQRPHQGRWCFGKTPMQTFP